MALGDTTGLDEHSYDEPRVLELYRGWPQRLLEKVALIESRNPRWEDLAEE